MLGQVVWVLVERDPLDAAVSILDARRRHYADPRAWWSYVPLEYDRLAGLDEWQQVAGQVHYLSRLYERELSGLGESGDPRALRGALRGAGERASEGLARRRTTLRPADPDRLRAVGSFPVRSYDDRADDKARFAESARSACRRGLTMAKTMAMHQPNYVPWLGYFHKLARCDMFVHLDTVQFPRGQSFGARNRIKTPNGVAWLTVPVARPTRP